MDQSPPINKPKVSVIIPVYNTEAYVEEAVRSIMNQTLRDIEIIIIDDGSTDNSLSVIKQLAAEDGRIQYLSQKNQGQSVARNVGIQKASGEYIYFMDSDDLLEKEAFDLCYHKCITENLDFIFFDAVNFGEINKLILEYDRKNRIDDNRVYEGIEIVNILLDVGGYRVPPWLHFIDLSFLQKEDILFDPNLKKYEDQVFSAKLYLFAHKVAYISSPLFRRRLRQGSLMAKYTFNDIKIYFNVADIIIGIGKSKNGKVQKTIDRIIVGMLNAAIYGVNRMNFRERLAVGINAFKNFRRYISLKTWIILLFPQSITIKSYLKSFFRSFNIQIFGI